MSPCPVQTYSTYLVVPKKSNRNETFGHSIGDESAILLSVATAAYTLTRLLGIYVAMRVKPEHILSLHYVIVLCSLVVLWFSDDSVIVMWIGNILFGQLYHSVISHITDSSIVQ